MVIKFGDAHFADGAVFRASRFDYVAGFAFVVLLVDDFVVVGLVFFDLLFVVLWCDFAGRDWTGFIVDPKTDEGQEVGEDDVEVADVVVGHVFEDTHDLVCNKPILINSIPSNGNDKIKYLNNWVISLHQVGLNSA